MKYGLPALIWAESRVLILGTLPSDESLRVKQYYANPSNQFWKILAAIFRMSMPDDYAARIEYLRGRHVALWDVLHAADRAGSQDRNIKNPQPNDFGLVLRKCPDLRAIALNGSRAATFFGMFGEAQVPSNIRRIPLPSTSPIPGMHVLGYQEKVKRWSVIASV